MISKNEYEMLKNIKKQFEKREAIEIDKVENIKYFPYFTAIIEDFPNDQYPLLKLLQYEGLSKYIKDPIDMGVLTLNSDGLSAYEEYQRVNATSFKSWISVLLSIFAIIISIIALFL